MLAGEPLDAGASCRAVEGEPDARSRSHPRPGGELKWIVAALEGASSCGDDPDDLGLRPRIGPRIVTPLDGGAPGRVAVIIQPAAPNEVAPLVALAYGLTDREAQIVRLCMQGRSTKQMAKDLAVSPYTIQDHLKAGFDKTGVRTRNELVGQIFLEHYCPRWESIDNTPSGWTAHVMPSA